MEDLPLAQALTPREQDILEGIGDELTNRQIATRLTLSPGTVKWYVRQVYNKLGVDNREDAAARARILGLLPQEESAFRHNLPVPATPFVGRADELAALAGLVADPQTRIITITGPGGMGKTRLALEAAGRELHPDSRFADGVFFVSLAPLETAAEIAASAATALNFQFQGSGNEMEQLLNYLRNKQMLLVMDNFEHLLDGRGFLSRISEQAAAITLLVTSRERLQMRGEQLFPLQGLNFARTVDSALEEPAAELFLNIARRTIPDFQLLAGDKEHLLRICRLVEGMPLGLELAASWVGLLPLSEISAEIEQSLDFLAAEHSDVPRRHQSMAAALDVSWRLLTEEQRRAFMELTVFRGGFTRTAAMEAAGATLPILVTLANKSWLAYDRHKDRYHIHELLRQYGAARLSADPTHEQEVRDRHCAFFCDFLQERKMDWCGARQQQAASELRDDIDNIQRAWRRATGRGDSLLLAHGLHSLCHFYIWEGRLQDGKNACRMAADGLSQTAAKQQEGEGQRLVLWSVVLAWESDFTQELAHKEQLLARSQQLLDQAAQAGYDIKSGQAFLYLSKVSAVADYEERLYLASRGLELSREIDDHDQEAEALKLMGDGYLGLGNYAAANEFLRSSLDLWQQMADTWGMAESATLLSLVAWHQGFFAEAETLSQQSVRLFREMGFSSRESWSQSKNAYSLIFAGKFLAGREAAGQAVKIDRDLGHHPNPHSLTPLGLANLHLGDFARAKRAAGESLSCARKQGALDFAGWALNDLGNIAFAEGEIGQAKNYLQESANLLAEVQHILRGSPLADLGYVARTQGDQGAARELVINLLHLSIEHRSFIPVLKGLPLAALLAADCGNHTRAVELYSLAQQFGHIKNSRWFADVACRELDKVRASLPAEKAAAAEERGRELDVWETAEALLRELDGR